MSEITVPKGLVGVVVDRTAICTTDAEGNLVYRGYSAVDLVQKKSFEEVAYLVVNGELPDREELKRFNAMLISKGSLDPRVIQVIDIMKERDLMKGVRSIISLYPYTSATNEELLPEIIAKVPAIIAFSHASSTGRKVHESHSDTYSGRFYEMITGNSDTRRSSFLSKLMILYMEHEFNASTFVLRVAASTLTDPASAFTAALGTLKGPLHGGANAEILDFFKSFRSTDEAIKYVDSQLESGKKVMGFGHRVYKQKDPRAQIVKQLLRELNPESRELAIAEAIEARVWEKKHLPANLDFYAAILMDQLGIPQELYTAIFAASRVFGWWAHYLEQLSDNKLIRPSSEYVGPKNRTL